MSSYAPFLPLTLDGQDGFVNIKDFGHLIKQNLKMLVLTNPGERIMMPNFGIGLKKILFELKKMVSFS
jgi:phage baseplate assembly protein W